MKNKQKKIVLFILLVSAFGAILFLDKSDRKLVSPQQFTQLVSQTEPSPTPSLPDVPAYNPPPEIKYNANTNLQAELQAITPQIMDNDFTELKTLIQSIK